ncbi:MAG: hypothetical protein P4L98_02120 [Ancalomicrobiaceae bacterium]|nr:hypothetical protein [Ancalomicrobiaceae bacterium]
MADPKFVAAVCAHAVLAALSLDDLESGADDEAFTAIAGAPNEPLATPPKPAGAGAARHGIVRASFGFRPLMRH